MKKPTVNRKRITRKVFIDYHLDIEVSAISLVKKLQNYIDEAEKDPLKCSEVEIEIDRYGYNCGDDVGVYYEAYDETEEEFNKRVLKELEALLEWEKGRDAREEAVKVVEEKLNLERIKEMEEELTKLKEKVEDTVQNTSDIWEVDGVSFIEDIPF